MGQVIRIDNRSGSTDPVLTETGTGGLFSAGYLRDEPAGSYLDADERPVFVLTNEKRGIDVDDGSGTERISSGSSYRTIAVVTDRRLVIVVGDSDAPGVEGDQHLAVRLVDVVSVDAESGRREGRLTVSTSNERTITVHAGVDGLDEAAAYVAAASQAWIHVENTLEDVKRSLVGATDHVDAGEYDAALEAARDAYNGLNEPRRAATQFESEWTAPAMTARVDRIQRRCAGMLAEVRRARARRFADDAESRWRDDEFEAALDAYERADAELQTVLTYDSSAVDDRDEVHEQRDRIDRSRAELEAAPLRRAVEAETAASDADDALDAAGHWADALEAYQVVLELDWGADERRFAGDPDAVRDRLRVVVEGLVSAWRAGASSATSAGDWYVGAEQYDVAIEEFETARDRYDRAIALARERYPDATDHLTVERDGVVARLDRARALRDGDPLDPVETRNDGDPVLDVEASIGAADRPDDETTADGRDDGESADATAAGSESDRIDDVETQFQRLG